MGAVQHVLHEQLTVLPFPALFIAVRGGRVALFVGIREYICVYTLQRSFYFAPCGVVS